MMVPRRAEFWAAATLLTYGSGFLAAHVLLLQALAPCFPAGFSSSQLGERPEGGAASIGGEAEDPGHSGGRKCERRRPAPRTRPLRAQHGRLADHGGGPRIRLSIDGSQFLHDPGLWSVSLSGGLEFRIFRGLNLDVNGDLEFIEDQIFISREGLTDEEILLGRFERPTDMTYELGVGLSFEFGSIFNNVVNNRFDSRDFGGGGDFGR